MNPVLIRMNKACSEKQPGFTLLELIVVVFIISLAMALIMPSFRDSGKNTLKTEAKHISSTLRYIYDEAVGKKQVYIFIVDFDNKSWGFKSEKESRNYRIKNDLEITDVVVPSLGKISTGEIVIKFGPLGPDEPIVLHLKKNTDEYTVIFNHLNGRTKILEEYTL